MNPFDFVKDIQRGKRDVIRNSENPAKAEALYNAYIVNRALSFYPDSIMYANEVNQRADMPGLLQFDYLINTVRSMKRDHTWIKKTPQDEDVLAIAEYLGMSPKRAQEAMKVLTRDQLEELKSRTMKGGT